MNRPLIAAVGILALVGGWALFRPELLFIDKRVDEALPVALTGSMPVATSTLASGSFRGLAHETSGDAMVHRLADGSRVLRFSNFATSNGPDLRVLLVAADDPRDNAAVSGAERVELGALKGNVGDQNYVLPGTIDLAKFRSVVVWCNRFSVAFASAPLGAAVMDAPLKVGVFAGVAHETMGDAAIHRLADGSRILRFTKFTTSNGPDLRVLLVAADDPRDDASVSGAERIELGALKGNVGDQNYVLPAEVDLSKFRSVVVWCNRFGVNFASAPLR